MPKHRVPTSDINNDELVWQSDYTTDLKRKEPPFVQPIINENTQPFVLTHNDITKDRELETVRLLNQLSFRRGDARGLRFCQMTPV